MNSFHYVSAGSVAILRALNGYYPNSDTEGDLYWDRSPERAIIPIDSRFPSRLDRLEREIDAPGLRVGVDESPSKALELVAQPRRGERSWANKDVQRIYFLFKRMGVLRTFEAYEGAEMVGALVGIDLGGALLAETMFSRKPSASKACLVAAGRHCIHNEYKLIDVQVPHKGDHPSRKLGEKKISLEEYLKALHSAVDKALLLKIVQRALEV